MYFYDLLTLICCCLVLVVPTIAILAFVYFVTSTDRQKRRDRFKSKLRESKTRRKNRRSKNSTGPSTEKSTEVEDAEFHDVK